MARGGEPFHHRFILTFPYYDFFAVNTRIPADTP
jgi:hypothetical protein